MAIRRRRKTLTNLLSTMERRVTAVELRPINLLTANQIAGALADEDEDLDGGPDSVVSLSAPNQYKPITDGYYYSSNISGNPRVELYFSGDPGLAKDKTIKISGINTLFKNSNGTGPIDFDISKDHKVLEVDTPPYDSDRNTYGGKRDTPEETVDSTATFNPKIPISYQTKRKLAVKARISTVQATTNVATIVFSEPHYFKDNQIIYVNLPDTPYFGRDGLFRISEVVNNTTIKYEFDSSLEEPINLANITEERHVHAVAQSAIRDGATWFDTSQNPDVAYVWDDYRWVLFGSASVDDDNMPPKPITNLTATDANDTPPGSGEPRMEITLEWTAPTQNQDGTPLEDLYGYRVEYRQYQSSPWRPGGIVVSETTWTGGGFLPAKTAHLRVFAQDSGGNQSTPVEISHLTGNPAPVVSKPSAPSVTTYLGTIKITYDDLTAFGLTQSPTASEIEVYFSQQSGFTPGPSNFYGKFIANRGSYIIIPGTELTDGVDYYVKLIVRDIYGNITEPSEQVSIRAKLSNIVTFDMINVGTLSGQTVIGLQLATNSNPSRFGGIVINNQGITAYAPPPDPNAPGASGSQTFSINALTGSVSIGQYLGREEANTLYISEEKAGTTYATIQRADGIAFIAGNASAVANTALGIATEADKKGTAVTEFEPGTGLFRLKRSATIRALNSGRPNPSETQINGAVIETGTLFAEQIGSGEFPADVVYAGTINASQISAGTIAGRTIRTSVNNSGKRVVLSNSLNAIQFYNTNGVLMGQIDGQTNSGGLLEISGPGTPGLTIGVGSTVFSGAVSATGNITSTQRVGQVVFSSLGGTTAAVHRIGGGSNAFLFGPASSDERLKKDIVELENSLDLINNLRPVKFRFKAEEDGPFSYGLIAQEVQQFFDENDNVVNSYQAGEDDEDKEEYFSIEYNAFIAPLIGAIKELTQKNLDLEARIANLEGSLE